MNDSTHYAKTEKGIAEIRTHGRNLRGRIRTMLFLVDPSRSCDSLRLSAAQIGVEGDFLEALLRDGYIEPVNGQGDVPSAPSYTVTDDELARFREAKAFINETVVDALGVRAFMFTLKLERCSTREELGRLLPHYEKQVAKVCAEAETRLLVGRAEELLAR